MIKKAVAAAAAAMMMVSSAVSAQTDIKIYINGQELVTSPSAYVKNDRIMVPMRTIFEALGANVMWDAEQQTITSAREGKIVMFQIDNPYVFTKEGNTPIDVPPEIVDDRTMVPARAVSEAFDIPVEWNGETRQVIINF